MTYGWVRVEGETNEEYLASVPATDPWRALILDVDTQLSQLDPDYRIIQIKEKFGELRYYFDSRLYREIPEIRTQMEEVVNRATEASYDLN